MRKKRESTSTQVSTTHPILHAMIERAPPATHPYRPRHPPTSVIDSRRRFQRHTRNRASQLDFEFFNPNLSTLLAQSNKRPHGLKYHFHSPT